MFIEYKIIVKSIVKSVGCKRTIKNPTECVVKRACLAEHNEKLDEKPNPLIDMHSLCVEKSNSIVIITMIHISYSIGVYLILNMC